MKVVVYHWMEDACKLIKSNAICNGTNRKTILTDIINNTSYETGMRITNRKYKETGDVGVLRFCWHLLTINMRVYYSEDAKKARTLAKMEIRKFQVGRQRRKEQQ